MSNEWIVAAVILAAFKPEIMTLFYRIKKQVRRRFR